MSDIRATTMDFGEAKHVNVVFDNAFSFQTHSKEESKMLQAPSSEVMKHLSSGGPLKTWKKRCDGFVDATGVLRELLEVHNITH